MLGIFCVPLGRARGNITTFNDYIRMTKGLHSYHSHSLSDCKQVTAKLRPLMLQRTKMWCSPFCKKNFRKTCWFFSHCFHRSALNPPPTPTPGAGARWPAGHTGCAEQLPGMKCYRDARRGRVTVELQPSKASFSCLNIFTLQITFSCNFTLYFYVWEWIWSCSILALWCYVVSHHFEH